MSASVNFLTWILRLDFAMRYIVLVSTLFALVVPPVLARADEHLFGYVKGAEPLPVGSWELYQIFTQRSDKGAGNYRAWDTETEVEYGLTDRFAMIASLSTLSIDTSGLRIDAYIPQDNKYSLRPSGLELAGKYNYLSAAKDVIGLSSYSAISYDWIDPHSGLNKKQYSFEYVLAAQKYFLEGELIWVANLGFEGTYAIRSAVADLPAGFEWPTHPEVELETTLSSGLSYRFLPKWFAGIESSYETEYETEVGRERYTLFLGPSLHFGSIDWWSTVTYFHQHSGGDTFPAQDNKSLHLIEKTKQEIRLKVGLNF